MTDEEVLKFYNHPPVKEGYIRIYEDHTGRGYKDVLESEVTPDENTPEGMLTKIFWDEFRREIDLDLLEEIYIKIKSENYE